MPRRKRAVYSSAEDLWRAGAHEHTFGIPFENIEMRIHKVVVDGEGKPKALIVNATDKSENLEHWVYYPKKEHLSEFRKSSLKVLYGGPANIFPGAVGSIEVIKDVWDLWEINYIQSHFKTQPGGPVTRSLATKYGGWSNRVLAEIFAEAAKEDKKVSIQKRAFSQDPSMQTKARSEMARRTIFKEAALKSGFLISEKGTKIIAEMKK